MAEWAYEMGNKDLVSEFGRVCGRSGSSNNGCAIDCSGSMWAEEARYFKGVLLARLEGAKPPFKPGDKVKVGKNNTARSTDWRCEFSLPPNSSHKIHRIHYGGEGKWFLEIKNPSPQKEDRSLFDLGHFVYKLALV